MFTRKTLLLALALGVVGSFASCLATGQPVPSFNRAQYPLYKAGSTTVAIYQASAARSGFLSSADFATFSAGGGDVDGPASSTDEALARFDGTTGKILQNYTSGAPTCGDTGACTFRAPVTMGDGTNPFFAMSDGGDFANFSLGKADTTPDYAVGYLSPETTSGQPANLGGFILKTSEVGARIGGIYLGGASDVNAGTISNHTFHILQRDGGAGGGCISVEPGGIYRFGKNAGGNVCDPNVNEDGDVWLGSLNVADGSGNDTIVLNGGTGVAQMNTISMISGSTITFTDGTNTLVTITDAGSIGNLTMTGGGSVFASSYRPVGAGDNFNIKNSGGTDIALFTNAGNLYNNGGFNLLSGTAFTFSDSAGNTLAQLVDIGTSGVFKVNAVDIDGSSPGTCASGLVGYTFEVQNASGYAMCVCAQDGVGGYAWSKVNSTFAGVSCP